jgi:2-hydroxychromene-2-carboxylate isomerase
MKEVDFYFDFASPNAYLSLIAGKELEDKLGFKFNIKLALLGGIFKLTNNQPPMVAFAGIKNKLDYDGVEMQRFINKHNLSDFKMNPNFPVITLQIMRAAVVAEKEGFLMDYVQKITRSMWEREKKMDDPEVIKAEYDHWGFDSSLLMDGMNDPDIKSSLMDKTSEAVERGVFGIPTFFVGSEMFFGKDRLGQVEEEILK